MSAPTACRNAPSGGRLALLGRAKLRADMTAPAADPPPMTDLEAQAALRHVPNADAVAFALGQVTHVGFGWCESCDSWVPTFTETG